MTIREKVAFSVSAGLLLLTAVSGILLGSIYFLRKTQDQVLAEMEDLAELREWSRKTEEALRRPEFYVVVPDPAEAAKFSTQTREILGILTKQEDLSAVAGALHSAVRLGRQIFTLTDRGSREAALRASEGEYRQARLAVQKLFGERIALTQARLDRARWRADRIRDTSLVISVSSVAGMALLDLFLVFWLYRSIMGPLASLEKAADRFGEGDLSHRVRPAGRDELGRLAAAFNQMAENLQTLQTQVVHMDRMASTGQLAGGVAHEINNPLQGVLGQVQLLLEKVPKDSPYRDGLEKIERAALRCRRIVRGLLDFSRQQDYQFQPSDLAEVLDGALLLCETELTSCGVEVVKKLDPQLGRVRLSPPHMQQVFLNLIQNSLHAMPKGGRLTIETKRIQGDSRDGGETARIRVEDTGVGIAPEHLDRVFLPFFTTKEVGQGTGLGLAVSLGIVRNHGGTIRAESAGPGKGATFTVEIPVNGPRS